MQISRLLITKLFGFLNHEVTINTRERITIIHGPNGVGKTTLLRLVQAVFTQRFDILRQIDFGRFEIRFTNRQRLLIVRDQSQGSSREAKLTITLFDGETKKQHSLDSHDGRRQKPFPFGIVDDVIPHLTQIGPELWLDRGETITINSVIARYGEYFPSEFLKRITVIPDWLEKVLQSIPIYFIQTQRLLASAESTGRSGPDRRDQSSRMTVEDLSKDMARRIQEVLRSSAVVAASLDRTFPHRLLQGKLPGVATEKAIRKRYEEQSAYRQRLMDAGLLQPEETLPLQADALAPNERKVLWYYLGDIDKKLAVYRDLLDRVELFTRIINDDKFLYKRLSIHKDSGFIFTSDNGKNVPLSALSSGEQHELVLAYELLFRAPGKSLILIDEPELSLHVTWQHKFLEDMKEISALADIDFLIATHSPSIVHRRIDLMIELGGESA